MALVEFARSRNVDIRFDTTVTDLTPSAGGFAIKTSQGDLHADRVVVATGGLSVPATGSDGIGLDIARRLDHRMIDTYPALTPLLSSDEAHASLSGVSLNVRLRAKMRIARAPKRSADFSSRTAATAAQAFSTSRTSRRDGENPIIRAQWSTRTAAEWAQRDLRSLASASVSAIVARHVPARLGDHLMREAGIPSDRRTSSLKRSERLALIDALTAYPLPWSGNEGYKKAEVTGGGVALGEVDPKTLESKRVAGLYLCGEMLDAFGPIGGHNFSWAWATGRAAGIAAGIPGPP